MRYEVKIDEFEGPLDLLLHLIKKSNIDIYDISLEEITNQYLDYIKAMKELNLDIASEYLVMASELLEYKSKSLLPKKEDEEEIDPKDTLIKKLVDYKRYKEITEIFKELESERGNVFTKTPSNYNDFDEKVVKSDELSVDDLVEAFKRFRERIIYEKPLNTKITTRELSVTDRIKSIRSLLKNKKRINFMDLFEVRTKKYVVVTFLSILEMSKDNEIKISQEGNFKEIVIEGLK